MRTVAWTWWLLAACAPVSEPGSAEPASSSAALSSAPSAAPRPADPARPETAARAETDERPARGALEDGGWIVDPDGVLWSPDGARVLAGALGRPAALGVHAAVVTVLREPGESELWLARAGGGGRWLAPAVGPDESPTALPDGRVLFASGRTGVMSMWIVDPRTDRAEQRTNVGLVPGGSRRGFVPPPVGAVTLTGDRAAWDDGYGARWSIALAEGAR